MNLEAPQAAANELCDHYRRVRQRSQSLCQPLAVDDYNIQTMPDVSPAKWHLAHTSWFFETFVLTEYCPGYKVFNARFGYLFNSYYEAVGERHARPQRGHLSRPTVEQVYAYRAHVDEAVLRLLDSDPEPRVAALVHLGLEHEQQHQELLLTDIKHVLASNPLQEAYHQRDDADAGATARAQSWLAQPEGLYEIGFAGGAFAFDNESPRHRVWLRPYQLADRPVTQAEWLEFMADGGYQQAALWLSDGWTWAQQQQAPLYWFQREGEWWQYTMYGPRPVAPERPVAHLSFYEAEAFARWAGARLPTEAEWEVLAATRPLVGDFQEAGQFEPLVCAASAVAAEADFFFGGVWEWTASSYGSYPGYRPPVGALGEYNAKFMASQLVLRGGSCATPRQHLRATYRNFFYPHQQWQYSGLRLARDD